jgi:hypothetical protein
LQATFALAISKAREAKGEAKGEATGDAKGKEANVLKQN